jgi:hypothetical protein
MQCFENRVADVGGNTTKSKVDCHSLLLLERIFEFDAILQIPEMVRVCLDLRVLSNPIGTTLSDKLREIQGWGLPQRRARSGSELSRCEHLH